LKSTNSVEESNNLGSATDIIAVSGNATMPLPKKDKEEKTDQARSKKLSDSIKDKDLK
jgi:hypothetical protein